MRNAIAMFREGVIGSVQKICVAPQIRLKDARYITLHTHAIRIFDLLLFVTNNRSFVLVCCRRSKCYIEALHSWCIVETILSIIIFVHAMKEVVEMLKSPSDGDLLPYDVLACTGCAVGCAAWTEVSHSFCPSTSEGAVDSIASINEGGVSRLGSDGVDLFEYHDVITTGLKIWKVVSV